MIDKKSLFAALVLALGLIAWERPCAAGFVQLLSSASTAGPGDVITITQQVTFESADMLPGYRLGGFDVALLYDATRFSLSNVRLGSLVAANFAGTEQFNTSGPGQLTGLASTNNFSGVTYTAGLSGALLQFDITIKAGAPAGLGEINLVPLINSSATDVVLFNPTTFDTTNMVFSRPVTNAFDAGVDLRITVGAVPEPHSVALFCLGSATVFLHCLRRRRADRRRGQT